MRFADADDVAAKQDQLEDAVRAWMAWKDTA